MCLNSSSTNKSNKSKALCYPFVMRTSRRLGGDSIESIPGSGVMQFFGFSLVLFKTYFMSVSDIVGVLIVGV